MASSKKSVPKDKEIEGKDETNPPEQESDTPSDDTEGVETSDEPEVVVEAPKPRSIADRVKDIETRWGKGIQEVMIELHDHVFGTSPPHEEAKVKKDE